jgi:hypothetical protein
MILAVLLHDYTAIFISTTLGSYLFFRGLGWVLNNFPTPSFVLIAMNTNQTSGLKNTFWIYLVAMLLISLISFVVQFSHM